MEGASLARGELLIFCHADTRLPRGYDDIIREALEEPDVWLTGETCESMVAGCISHPPLLVCVMGSNYAITTHHPLSLQIWH